MLPGRGQRVNSTSCALLYQNVQSVFNYHRTRCFLFFKLVTASTQVVIVDKSLFSSDKYTYTID